MTQLQRLSQDQIASEAYEFRLREKRDVATLVKAARQEGVEQGLAQGVAQGVEQGRSLGLARGEWIGAIYAYEELLQLERTPTESLAELDNDELRQRAESLKTRVQS